MTSLNDEFNNASGKQVFPFDTIRYKTMLGYERIARVDTDPDGDDTIYATDTETREQIYLTWSALQGMYIELDEENV